jgi:hypothetical protein
MAQQVCELWDRDELNPGALKVEELELINYGVGHIDLEHRAPNQSTVF